jgi:DNA polymerase I-like protein with 3'-5' exonuclease and polymerase domains
LNYGSSAKKVASQLGIPLQEGQEIFNNYWDLYAPTREYNKLAVQEALGVGYVTSRFSGLRLKLASINAKDEYVRSKEERVASNFKIQSGNFLTLRGLHKFQSEIEKHNKINEVLITNTVHDSIKFYIEDTAETVAWVNTTLIPILCEDYRPDQLIKLEAELDIGLNEKEVHTLNNSASISDIEEVLKTIKGL